MRKLLALTTAIGIGTAALAQEAPKAAETRAVKPQEITRAVHGSWQIRCITGGSQQCFLYQLIADENNTPMLEFSMIPAVDENNAEVKMVGTIVTPLNVMLGRGIIMAVDDADPVVRAYGYCAPIGCFSRFPVLQSEVDAYVNGSDAYAAIFHISNPTQEIEVKLPLDGFNAAYSELMEIETEQKSE